MKISNKAVCKSSKWIKRNARPLEAARWEYFFEGYSQDQVIHYLSAFQNKDGGFGHGIEPDFWSPYSSPMATWAAGQILIEIGANPTDEIVKSMISYLVNTYDKETGMWASVLPETNQYPHAPWWHWEEGVQEKWMFNPSAELAAFLVHWSSEESETSEIGWSAIEKAIDRLMKANEMERHEINNYQQLIKIMNLHKTTFNTRFHYSLSEVSNKVMSFVEKSVEWDASEWSTGYKSLPLDFIDSPEHPLSEKFSDLIEQNLNFYIETISDEGTWDISWNWGGYPEEFAVSRRYWKGILTVNRYKLLKSFGYLL
ncbi:MAG TPA: hypothetical protein VNM69_20530 [Bacillus sp. (in: firmicutes)]|uniref:hypothetical protein n=1 Tax=Bacillus litorisediminis TaxID=2922713 RepID=UPI001FAC1CDA|nr:hypothetical protein [Bacillus litorisediminis]HWO78259.1 hypothetical protein [Bacillus sp. (in: firmicutes)]